MEAKLEASDFFVGKADAQCRCLVTPGDDGLNTVCSTWKLIWYLYHLKHAGLVAFSAATALLPFGAEKLCLNWHQCSEFTQKQQGLNRE